MNQKDKRYILEKIFEKGVDGNNSNAYGIVVAGMDRLPLEVSRIEISMQDLKMVLWKLSKKWDKEIDEVIEG